MSELKLHQCRVDGRYDVLDCLGRGSYSEVYVARDLAATDGAPQMVVLKALNQYLQGSPDPDLEQTLIDNFRNEAAALDRVRHPNIISRLGHGTAIDLHGRVFHYLVLEYLPGGDMQHLCRRRPLKLEGALFYLRQLAAGLEHAHERGVIHRDIKPQNILLTADQHTAKIADFGVAKIEAADGAITRVGTDLYAAPEHHPLRHTGPLDTASLTPPDRQLTPAADVYSLAKTAYTLLTGDSPRHFSQKPITKLPPPFAEEPWAGYVLRVLERATQTNPSKRYQTVREFWDDLQDAAMPKTKVLGSSDGPKDALRSGRQVDDSQAVTPPPPAPTFKERVEPVGGERAQSSSPHLRIVVPVALESHREVAPPAPRVATPPQRRQEERVAEVSHDAPRTRGARLSDRMKKWLVALLLILAFSGMLLATHFYFSREPQQSVPPSRPAASSVGRELVATIDVNLRGAPSAGGQLRGKIPKESVVKVLSENEGGGWIMVQIVRYGRPKDNPDYADQGWADRTYFRER